MIEKILPYTIDNVMLDWEKLYYLDDCGTSPKKYGQHLRNSKQKKFKPYNKKKA